MQPIRLSLGGSKASGSGTKLSLKSKSAKSAVKPSVFGQQGTQEDDDDDDDEDDRNAAGGQAGKGKSKAKPGAPPSAAATTLSRKERLQREEQLKLDQTVFEYDEVYDNMKAGERQAELEKRKEAGDRKVCTTRKHLLGWPGADSFVRSAARHTAQIHHQADRNS